MADDVDPDQSLPSEGDAETGARSGAADVAGSARIGAPSGTRVFEPVEIAMVEIEVVDLETVEREPEPEPGPETELEPDAAPEMVVLEATALDVVMIEEAEVEPPVAMEQAQPEFEETVPEETVPEETVPEETVPEETVPEETVPEDVVSVGVEPEVEGQVELDESMEPVDALPTMADLDRVASELDEIDARLAALDEQRP